MKKSDKMIIVGIIAFAVMLSYIFLFRGDDGPGKYDAFAQCLTEKGVVMYGTEWCPHCKEQKKQFGKSFEYVNYVDCDAYDEVCASEGITGYPTWKIGIAAYPGTQTLQKLSLLSDCPLN